MSLFIHLWTEGVEDKNFSSKVSELFRDAPVQLSVISGIKWYW